MSIVRVPGTCILVHLTDSEAHFPDVEQAMKWANEPHGVTVRAIEPAQMPCWMAYCDEPACEHPEGDEEDNAVHLMGETADEVEQQLSDIQRQVDGRLLCAMCRDELAAATPADGAWADKQGDIWRLGDDGLMHSFETAPFARDYVEKKWGPLRLLDQHAADHH